MSHKKHTCTVKLPNVLAMPNCEYYNPDLYDWYETKYLDTCAKCKSNLIEYDAYLKTANCRESTAPGSYCQRIDNCLQTVCFKSRNPGPAVTDTWTFGLDFIKSTVGCKVCKYGYYGIDFDNIWDTGSGSCIKEDDDKKKIKNCYLSMQLSDTHYKCVQCNKGYAVMKVIYISYFTTDSNVAYTGEEDFLASDAKNKF